MVLIFFFFIFPQIRAGILLVSSLFLFSFSPVILKFVVHPMKEITAHISENLCMMVLKERWKYARGE